MPSLAGADEYLSLGMEAAVWLSRSEEERKRALVSAERMLKGLYPGVSIPDEAIYLQAAWMFSETVNAMKANTSSVSVSTSGVSTSFSNATRDSKDFLCPEVKAMFGGAEEGVKTGVFF